MALDWKIWAAGGALLGVAVLGGRRAMAYIAGKPIGTISLTTVDGKPVEAQTARQYKAMQAAAAGQGIVLRLASGFRTMEEQERLYAAYRAGTGNLAAVPGHSNHQNGTAIDIEVGGSFTSPAYRWLAANAAKYGFKNTGASFSQPEPWHWERTGPMVSA